MTILTVASSIDEANSPRSFLKRRRNKELGFDSAEKPTVVCVGDSLTRGNLSADWVGGLRDRLMGRLGATTVLNAGINMHCAKNVLARIDEIVACQPSHVTVLVGTNDIKGELCWFEGQAYRLGNQLPAAPTLEEYELDLLEIRDRLLASGARVALISPPVLGEDSLSTANLRAAAYAQVVKRVVATGGRMCSYLPLFERTSAALPDQGGLPYESGQSFAWLCTLVGDMYGLRRSMSDVMDERGLNVTIDLVHLGPGAAEDLVGMVEDFVTSGLVKSSPSLVAAGRPSRTQTKIALEP